ncbi:MAG TPA: hypothetical protein VFX39_01025 [Gemmatimonadaceae bacterium]|nr:hypothetical protein [Gemmatimonadaceae bacterium]
MLNIFETGDESFRLADQLDVNVGWVRGSALGFDGFETEADATAAAVAGGEALAGYLERLTGSSQRAEEGGGRVRVAKDGPQEWVVRGATRLARLFRPDGDDALDRRRDTFGVEFVLPSYVKPGAAISAAQVVHKAIGNRAVAARAKGKTSRKGATPLPLGGLGGEAPARVDGVAAR